MFTKEQLDAIKAADLLAEEFAANPDAGYLIDEDEDEEA